MKLILEIYLSLLLVRDVLEEIIRGEDVVLLRIHVMREKETVMDLEMEDNMMDMQGVREILYVEAIIVNSLELITMKKMIAVRNQNQKKS